MSLKDLRATGFMGNTTKDTRVFVFVFSSIHTYDLNIIRYRPVKQNMQTI